MSEDVLNSLEDKGLIVIDGETGLPVKTDTRHLRETEVVALMLPYVMQDVKISNRQLAKVTGLNARTVGKYRTSDKFTQLLVEHTNKKMINVRCEAIEELQRMLRDPALNENTRVKVIHEILAHCERTTELMLQAGQMNPPVVNVDDILKELENM